VRTRVPRMWRVAVLILACIGLGGQASGQTKAKPGSRRPAILRPAATVGQTHPLFPLCHGTYPNVVWGYMGATGKIVVPLTYKGAAPFSEGLGRVKFANGKWGFIDSEGRVVILPSFEGAGDFHEGLARVTVNGKSGFINRTGNLVIQPTIGAGPQAQPGVRDFSNGVAYVTQEGRVGLINMRGASILTDIRYESEALSVQYQWGVSEGFLVVQGSRGLGYVNRRGIVVIPPKFQWARKFSDGLAAVGMGGKWGYIDHAGKLVIPFRYESALEFSDGLAPVVIGGKWGYVDRAGAAVIQPKFDHAREFSGGLAAVEVGTKEGFIDEHGNMRIAPQFLWSLNLGWAGFSRGIALLQMNNGHWVYVNKDGRIVAGTCGMPF
jgi:WG containing repeat